MFVSTDVAARGIDVDDVDIVFNCDVPDENQDYVHRIGRTGRAKRQGVAVTFISDYPCQDADRRHRPEDPERDRSGEVRRGRPPDHSVKTALNAGRGNPRPALFTPLVPAGRQGIFEFLL